jgi:type I restriction enzyme S subunit
MLNQCGNKATMASLNQDVVKRIKLKLPSKTHQDIIVDMLACYDDLIENNKRRIELLEESARQLYKEWFVRFRFPGHEHVEISDGVPEGWKTHELEKLSSVVKESTDPTKLPQDTPYIGLEHMPRRSFTLNSWEHAEKVSSTKYAFKSGDILFGKIRPYFHKVGFAITDGITSSDAIVLRPMSNDVYYVVLCETTSDQFISLASKTVREGSKMPRADWGVLKKRQLLVPPLPLLEVFNYTIESIVEQCKALSLQTQNLSQARDILLPKLMSGEIAV